MPRVPAVPLPRAFFGNQPPLKRMSLGPNLDAPMLLGVHSFSILFNPSFFSKTNHVPWFSKDF